MKKRFLTLFLFFVVSLSISATSAFAISFADCETTSVKDDFPGFNYITDGSSTRRWGIPVSSYIYTDGDGTITMIDAACEVIRKKVHVNKYDANNFSLISSKKFDYELEGFGGFFSGKKYNYIAYAQSNTKMDDSKEVIRVVKYDKDFNRLASFSLSNCFTVYPVDGGSLRMAEHDNELTIHTSRERYDGHQSQLTFTINTSNMTLITKNLGAFQINHVSHSFNQFVKYDNGKWIMVDLGDGAPRSVALTEMIDYPEEYRTDYRKTTDLFKIPGYPGANCTGVTIGGFEVSKNNYIVAINTIDHSKVTLFDNFNMHGLEKDERDIVVLIYPKAGGKPKQVYLTNYVDKGKLASTPYIVPIPNNRFVIMWEQYEYGTGGNSNKIVKENGIRYACIDENGKVISGTHTEPDVRLSAACNPMYLDGRIIWHYYNRFKKIICEIGIIGEPVKKAVYTDIVARINGHDIASFNVDGYTCVVAEDLWNYGFDLAWDAKKRVLHIDRFSGKKIISKYVAPTVKKEKLGKKSYDILYTDIKTYIDGKEVTSYNIGGKTLIYFKDLDEFGKVTYSNSKRRMELNVSGLK